MIFLLKKLVNNLWIWYAVLMFAYYCDKIQTVTCVYKIKENPHYPWAIDHWFQSLYNRAWWKRTSWQRNCQNQGHRKKEICSAHGFELIRVENSYAERYNYIKNILIQYFKSVRVYQNIGNCETIYLKADVVQI